MIDDHAQVEALMEKMEAALPIPAEMTSRLKRTLREQGAYFRWGNVTIKRIFYSGDEGGIMCDITPAEDAKEAFVVSLTQLRIEPLHPLVHEIRAYQRTRRDKLGR